MPKGHFVIFSYTVQEKGREKELQQRKEIVGILIKIKQIFINIRVFLAIADVLMSNDNGSGNNGNGAGGRSSDLVYYVFAQLKELLGDGATLERAAQVARALSNEFQDLRKQGPLFDKDCIEITSIGAYAVTAFTAGGAYRIDRKQVEAAHAAARRYGQRVEVPPAMVAESSRTIDTVLEN